MKVVVVAAAMYVRWVCMSYRLLRMVRGEGRSREGLYGAVRLLLAPGWEVLA